jgi:RHS repeat-associated protein
VYWYGKNIQGDIVAVYSSTGTVLMNYTYTAWGKTEISYYHSGASTTAVKNNLTYRGYYYDSDLGMYYLQSRYYDPIVCRFINADVPDVITASPTALTDKNLFAYCDNNPVMRADEDGMFWGTLFDVVSLGFSIYDVYNNPDDIWAWIGLAGDLIDLLPIVSGVGEATDLLRISKGADNLIDAADNVYDGVKGIRDISSTIDTTSEGIKYTDKVLKQMSNTADLHHSFPIMIDKYVDLNDAKYIVGGDKVERYLVEIPGSINGRSGVFEYIIDFDGWCNHRYFKEFK